MSHASVKQPHTRAPEPCSRVKPVQPLTPGRNQLFDNWWERAATLARVAPLLIALVGTVLFRPMGYYWE
jgi:hypothetical protein